MKSRRIILIACFALLGLSPARASAAAEPQFGVCVIPVYCNWAGVATPTAETIDTAAKTACSIVRVRAHVYDEAFDVCVIHVGYGDAKAYTIAGFGDVSVIVYTNNSDCESNWEVAAIGYVAGLPVGALAANYYPYTSCSL